MTRKKKDVYFTDDTQLAIIEYNNTDDINLKNKIYSERIKYPFDKLAEYMINTFKFPYIDISKQDMQCEVVSVLVEKLYMYKVGGGKAFSYFGMIAKNHLILKNTKDFKRFKTTASITEMPMTWVPENDFYEQETASEFAEFTTLMLKFWDIHLSTIFTKKRDIQIADAVLELFRRSDCIENYNKKHLYLLVREMTDCKTHYITKVVNEMKKYQLTLLNDYLQTGYIDFENNTFWKTPYL